MKYGNECGDRVMEFSRNHFTAVNDVIEKARLAYGKCCILQLPNEHGRELDSQEIVENARVYMVKRRVRWSSVKKSLFRDTRLIEYYWGYKYRRLLRMWGHVTYVNRKMHQPITSPHVSVSMLRALQFALFYNETLSRVGVVPDRALHDFYRRPRCKPKRDGALMKPSSPPPLPPYTPPQLNTHEYLYTSVVAVTVDGCAVPAHTYINQG